MWNFKNLCGNVKRSQSKVKDDDKRVIQAIQQYSPI